MDIPDHLLKSEASSKYILESEASSNCGLSSQAREKTDPILSRNISSHLPTTVKVTMNLDRVGDGSMWARKTLGYPRSGGMSALRRHNQSPDLVG